MSNKLTFGLLHSQKRASCNTFVDILLLSTCDMQLVDDKSVASQQTCSKLIVTCSKSANEKLILTDLLQLDENDKFVAIC